MDELQLQDLKNMEANKTETIKTNTIRVESANCLPAVDVQQNASPPMHDVAMVPKPPASGSDSSRPIT